MDVALNGQWSGMPQFFLHYLFSCLDKSVYVNILLHNGLQVSKSIIFWRNGGVLFLANCRLWMLLSVLNNQGCHIFLHYLFSCLDKSVYVNILLHNGLQVLKVLFWEEMEEFYFLAICWLCMLLSVVNDQACPVFPSLFILMFR